MASSLSSSDWTNIGPVRAVRDFWRFFISFGWVARIGMLVGLGFAGVLFISLGVGAYNYITDPAQPTIESEFHLAPKEDVSFPSDGPFGVYDKQQLQRGFQVFKEVCSACHSLHLVAFRDLEGIGYSEAEVKAIADQWQIEVPDINPDTGEAATRKAIPADHFPSPYPNEVAARAANNNALPPDLSLITKAREGGPAYVDSLLTGYRDPATYRNAEGKALPAENRPPETLHFNPYFANLNIAMPPPLTADGQVTFADGSPSKVGDMARDVSAFLAWTAEPKLENRHAVGSWVFIFLLVGTILAYLAYRNIWSDLKAPPVLETGPLEPENMAKRKRASRKAGIQE
jgi:ubiquinol-cytochrome c reductase cytochrome c1 subunit